MGKELLESYRYVDELPDYVLQKIGKAVDYYTKKNKYNSTAQELYDNIVNSKIKDVIGNDDDDLSKAVDKILKPYIESIKKEDVHDMDVEEKQTGLYRLLSRLESDCKYFLGNGNGYEKYLWAGSVEDHIAKMRELWNELVVKPEWLSMEDIDNYEDKMLNFIPYDTDVNRTPIRESIYNEYYDMSDDFADDEEFFDLYGDPDDVDLDYEHTNLYGGDPMYCYNCGSKLAYDEDGYSYCPVCKDVDELYWGEDLELIEDCDKESDDDTEKEDSKVKTESVIKQNDKFVLFKDITGYKVTEIDNYNSRVSNANRNRKVDADNDEDAIAVFDRYFSLESVKRNNKSKAVTENNDNAQWYSSEIMKNERDLKDKFLRFLKKHNIEFEVSGLDGEIDGKADFLGWHIQIYCTPEQAKKIDDMMDNGEFEE